VLRNTRKVTLCRHRPLGLGSPEPAFVAVDRQPARTTPRMTSPPATRSTRLSTTRPTTSPRRTSCRAGDIGNCSTASATASSAAGRQHRHHLAAELISKPSRSQPGAPRPGRLRHVSTVTSGAIAGATGRTCRHREHQLHRHRVDTTTPRRRCCPARRCCRVLRRHLQLADGGLRGQRHPHRRRPDLTSGLRRHRRQPESTSPTASARCCQDRHPSSGNTARLRR